MILEKERTGCGRRHPPLADLVPPPRKHRHRYHEVFAPSHKLRRAVEQRIGVAAESFGDSTGPLPSLDANGWDASRRPPLVG